MQKSFEICQSLITFRGFQPTCTSCHSKRELHTEPKSSHCSLARPDCCYERYWDLLDRGLCPRRHFISAVMLSPRGYRDSESVSTLLFLTHMAEALPLHRLVRQGQQCLLEGPTDASKMHRDVWLWMQAKNVTEKFVQASFHLRLS